MYNRQHALAECLRILINANNSEHYVRKEPIYDLFRYLVEHRTIKLCAGRGSGKTTHIENMATKNSLVVTYTTADARNYRGNGVVVCVMQPIKLDSIRGHKFNTVYFDNASCLTIKEKYRVLKDLLSCNALHENTLIIELG